MNHRLVDVQHCSFRAPFPGGFFFPLNSFCWWCLALGERAAHGDLTFLLSWMERGYSGTHQQSWQEKRIHFCLSAGCIQMLLVFGTWRIEWERVQGQSLNESQQRWFLNVCLTFYGCLRTKSKLSFCSVCLDAGMFIEHLLCARICSKCFILTTSL